MTEELKHIVTFSIFEGEPDFPCVFVPLINTKDKKWEYNWSDAEIVECKIRGAGHYFKITKIQSPKEVMRIDNIVFAEFCANYGEKGPKGAWSEHYWQGNIMAGEPALTTDQLYEKYNSYLLSKDSLK